jgi:siderophore ferric iron reductase
MQNNEYFEQLFSLSKQVTPYLSGQLAADNGAGIHITRNNSAAIQQLYQQLSHSFPEGGNAYWLTRTWDLLCWQPIYIAFISVYQLSVIPDIKHMSQSLHKGFISGFTFHTSALTFGSKEELIALLGSQLIALFESYREAVSQWVRIRPGFTKHLIADGLLNCIIKRQVHDPAPSNEYWLGQAKLWLNAFELPDKHLSSLQVDLTSNSLKLVRTSCCLVYKCQGRKLCTDCPRHPDNKR